MVNAPDYNLNLNVVGESAPGHQANPLPVSRLMYEIQRTSSVLRTAHRLGTGLIKFISVEATRGCTAHPPPLIPQSPFYVAVAASTSISVSAVSFVWEWQANRERERGARPLEFGAGAAAMQTAKSGLNMLGSQHNTHQQEIIYFVYATINVCKLK